MTVVHVPFEFGMCMQFHDVPAFGMALAVLLFLCSHRRILLRILLDVEFACPLALQGARGPGRPGRPGFQRGRLRSRVLLRANPFVPVRMPGKMPGDSDRSPRCNVTAFTPECCL